jgi:hypothetical protein
MSFLNFNLLGAQMQRKHHSPRAHPVSAPVVSPSDEHEQADWGPDPVFTVRANRERYLLASQSSLRPSIPSSSRLFYSRHFRVAVRSRIESKARAHPSSGRATELTA